ncbi:MAG TPA: regulatory iron-sulfur-containing complex subunit RicT [Chitinophagales bacterium]|nr:regulatory iron-sulfur-containing complex subunit RicT [Chitinophagales bacterium]HRG28295.1 regulatory iron-sulfur-containing complex subunit RicT [Chitinophagales bacterium]HRG86379.1 regulatory iron-sulfur-containing complex subunit RicT [Chitinophagales bacterium]HRH52970.1 regulatory iron-sulfur-containing complex subunit RicT [Chitinophagales bacterium]
MSCAGCSVGSNSGIPTGCRSNGHCATGGCNKLNTYDWLRFLPVPTSQQFHIHEISFKNGIRKGFYLNKNKIDVMTGDMVCVETESGFDVGRISLSGELVKLQMKKRKVNADMQFMPILRKATDNDLERMMEGRAMEGATMLKARVIARELNLDMKIGEVEYQGDKRKATFYYIADDRVDFRELIKLYAKEFRVKIEMRQIGARQEAGKIGGLGSCGRELCCSTWLTDFKSVGTNAARYQNLSINQSKLSGQCGRLKCCLNYELDTYMDALQEFPRDADWLQTEFGNARLIKTDIFKKLMVYEYSDGGKQYPLTLIKVREIKQMNQQGQKPEHLEGLKYEPETAVKEVEFVNVIEHVSLKTIERAGQKKRQQNQQNRNKNQQNRNPNQQNRNQQARPQQQPNKLRDNNTENRNEGDKRNNQQRNPNQQNRQNNPNRNNPNRNNNRNNDNNKRDDNNNQNDKK